MSFASMPVTMLIIALTCLVSWLAFSRPRLLNDLILWPPAIDRSREYHRLVTYGLVHADFGHLLVNMLTLFFFGGLLEYFYTVELGTLGFVLFYIGALVVSILPTYLKHRHDPTYRSLGASGAVSAVMFAFILFKPWSMIGVMFIIPMPAILYAVLYVAYSIYMDRQGTGNINHSAHLWGAAYGVAATLMVRPSLVGHFVDALLHRG
jgi:membrane associated rhomboid family serine protease